MRVILFAVLFLVAGSSYAACHTKWAALDGNWAWLTSCSPEYAYNGTLWSTPKGNKYYVPVPNKAHKEGDKDEGPSHKGHSHYWTYKKVEKEAK
jgi:hypothetical protein